MEIEAGSQVAESFHPRSGCCASTVEAHRPFGSKDSYWHNQTLVFIEPRNDFLSHQCARRYMMSPPQAVDISRQAFTPGSSNFVRSQIIEPTTRQEILLWKGSGPGIPDLHDPKGLLYPTHPAASCSSELLPPPISSRTGPRFPGRSGECGDDNCSFSCIC